MTGFAAGGSAERIIVLECLKVGIEEVKLRGRNGPYIGEIRRLECLCIAERRPAVLRNGGRLALEPLWI